MKIAAVFSDNMVLQRGRNIRVFGSCTDSEKAITVTSSAVNGLKYAKEKIYLGAEYLQSFKER